MVANHLCYVPHHQGGGQRLTPFLDVPSSPRCIGMPTNAPDSLPCSLFQGCKSTEEPEHVKEGRGSEEVR